MGKKGLFSGYQRSEAFDELFSRKNEPEIGKALIERFDGFILFIQYLLKNPCVLYKVAFFEGGEGYSCHYF